jgi:hypothetical protein
VNVRCEICGKQYDSRDPGVRYWYGEGDWSCSDEVACFDRIHMQRALDASAEPLRVVTP